MTADLLEAVEHTRTIVLDTGCSWPDAARKTLEDLRLSAEVRRELVVIGLAQQGKAFDRNNSRLQPGPSVGDLVTTALEPFAPYPALVRIFDVGDEMKRFLDCTPEDLQHLASSLRRTADGFRASVGFTQDVRAECLRLHVQNVGSLPAEALTRLNDLAPWRRG